MTRAEYEELNEFQKIDYLRCECYARQTWGELQHIITLPFPQNFLRFAYQNAEIDDGALEFFDVVFQMLLPLEKEIILMLMRDRMNLDDASEKLDIMPADVVGLLVKAGRRMKHPTLVRRFGNTVKFTKNTYEED